MAGRHVMTPDFSFEKDGMKAYLEVVGFWTEEYLAKKVQKLKEVHAYSVSRIIGVGDFILSEARVAFQAHQERGLLHLPIAEDGGFAPGEPEIGWFELTAAKRPTKMEPASLWWTYQAVKALSTLRSWPKYPEACVGYVLRQRTAFGFGDDSPSDRYYALSVLAMPGGLEQISSLH